jgi:antitoxin (DNA-binding transcriptional repressor) of toxin-antitoxin stability system
LKARLSKYLREVKAGRTICITDRGKPVGRLVPPDQPLRQRLQVMLDAGLAEWNGKPLPPMKPTARLKGGKSIADLIIEDRR